MVFIYGTHVENDSISRRFFHFLKTLMFWVDRVKRHKIAQNVQKIAQKIMSVTLDISGTIHHMIVICSTQV